MPSTTIDSLFFKDLYGTDEMRAVFDDLSLLQRWLDVEAALAQAEAEAGLIPSYAAEEIARRAQARALDTSRLKRLIDQTVHPIVPLIRVLADACDGDAGEFVHWGATTQDITDTANVLQVKEAMAIFERRLATLSEVLSVLALEQRDTVMAGRTHGQQALPITFGFKVAIWLAEIERHRERLAQCKPRVLVGQFGGAVGTLASLGEQGPKVQQRLMALLGLDTPLVAWHTARDGLAEFTALLGLIAATLGKIANEIISLQMSEVGEVEEPFEVGQVGSSTLPHKRNPMLCEAIVALARLVMNKVPIAQAAMIQEHERDWTGSHLEWAYLPDACILTDGALALATRVGRGLRVKPERMRFNLERLKGLMQSEAVMLALGRKVGRQTAHAAIYECAMRAVEQDRPFQDALAEDPLVARNLTAAEIEALLAPDQYTGLAGYYVDQVLKHLNHGKAELGEAVGRAGNGPDGWP
jgi:3-carboxy-cis,cis-muconate cycloisomerase